MDVIVNTSLSSRVFLFIYLFILYIYIYIYILIRPPVSANILYFLVHAIDNLGGSYRRNTTKRTIPLTEPSSRQYSPVLAYHIIILSRPFVNSTMVCEHVCGSTTRCARGGSLWNRAFAKGACSRPSCSLSSSRRLQTWPPRVLRRTKTSWTVYCI